jgi:hypothetical protein
MINLDIYFPWTEASKKLFAQTLKDNTELETVKFESTNGEEAHQIFK